MNNEFKNTFRVRKKTSVFPSNPVHCLFSHKEANLLQQYNSLKQKKKSNNNKRNKTFEQILSKFEKEICVTHKDKDTFNFLFQTIDTQKETKEDKDNTMKDIPKHIKCLSNEHSPNRLLTEETDKPNKTIVYEKRRVKPMNKLNEYNDKKNLIYSKKRSNEIKSKKINQKNFNNINNITINLNDKVLNNKIDSQENQLNIKNNDEMKQLKKIIDEKDKEIALLKEKLENKYISSVINKKKDILKESILLVLNKYSDKNDNSTSHLISEIKCILNQYN